MKKPVIPFRLFAGILHLQPSAKHCSAPMMKLALGKSAWLDWSSYTHYKKWVSANWRLRLVATPVMLTILPFLLF